MPTSTYTPLATTTVSSAGTTSVTFSSISQAYRDLILVIYWITPSSTGGQFRINGDTGSNYFRVGMAGQGSAAQSFTSTNAFVAINYNGAVTPDSSTTVVNIMDYSATDKHKNSLVRHNAPSGEVVASNVRWANTAAITSLTVFNDGGSMVGTQISLYGIAS